MLVGAMIAVMWVVAGHRRDRPLLAGPGSASSPRAVDGLDGIVFSPFLHGSWGHLIGNTVPFVVLGGVIALSGPRPGRP